MSEFDSSFSELFSSGIHKKKNSTKNLKVSRSQAKAKASRVASGSSEVVVKITGFGKGEGKSAAHIKYISRNWNLEVENERGEILGKEDIRDLASSWTADFADAKRYKSQRDTMHIFFSMPPGTPPEDVKMAVRNLLKDRFSENHEYVFALHTDQPHPHVHTSIKMLGFDGKRLRVDRDDLQSFREGFAANLRRLGIDAEATPRNVRGVVQKAENQIVRHIEAGDKTHPPRVSKVRAAKVRQAVDEMLAEQSGNPTAEKPWESKIREKNSRVREKWNAAASSLDKKTLKKDVNVRPDYAAAGRRGFTATQFRVAKLYKPDYSQSSGRPEATSHASLRNVSAGDVVHNRSLPEMLLHQNASASVGGRRRTGNDVRRQSASAYAITGRAGGADTATDKQGVEVSDAELSRKIKSFVSAMPPVKTESQALKDRLTAEFSGTPPTLNNASQDTRVANQRSQVADKTNVPSPAKRKDLER